MKTGGVRHCISVGAEIQCLGKSVEHLYNTIIARRRDNMNTSNKRVLKIIKIFDTSKKILDSNKLGILLSVSSRTVRNDMKEVNGILQDYGAIIQSEAGMGYLLKITDVEKYQEFKNNFLNCTKSDYVMDQIVPTDHNDRIFFIITKLLTFSLHQKVVNQLELADELFISLSTLKSYWKDIKKSLSRFELQLVADRSNGVRIEGDEAQIRHCISEYIFDKNDLLDLANNKFYTKVFSVGEVETLKKILLNTISKYNIHLTDMAFRGLLVHIVIILKRADIKNTIEYSEMEMKKLKDSIDFIVSNEITQKIKEEIGVDIQDEIFYLTKHFMSSKKFMQDESNVNKGEFSGLIQRILETIKTDIGIDFSGDEELLSGLTIHLGAAVNRLKFNMNIRNEILFTVKKSYPLAFEIAIAASKVIEKEENLKTNENEIGFLAVHFGAAIERNGCKEKTAIVVCGAGVATAMLLKSKLMRKFGGYLQIVSICPSYSITEELAQTVNYIFTTVPLKHIRATKVIQVNPILTEDDLEALDRVITSDSSASEVTRYHDFFKKELLFPGMSAYSKFEVLEKLTNKMIRGGYIDEKVKQSIFDRERMASTELGGLIAIPHALENNMEQPSIAIAILKNPIDWELEKVQVVFLMSIPKTQYDIWEPVFKKIYRYFVRNLGVNDLIKEQKFDVLMNNLEMV
jgi:lichenan operon transcriptional antiterminator